MRSIDEIVAINIQLRMDGLHLNQLKLATLIDVSKDHVNKLLNGKKSVSRSTSLPKIAEVLGCSEIDLFQDPSRLGAAGAREQATASYAANLKALNRTLTEHLGEQMNEVKALNEELAKSRLSAKENDLLVAFRAAPANRQTAILEFARTTAAGKVKVPARKVRR